MPSGKMIVGGEFVCSPSILFKPNLHQFSDFGGNLADYQRYYTFGAYYSILAVLENLRFTPGEYALLPSYLCPTIITPFQKLGIRYDFYKMQDGLLPDIEDIERKSRSGLKVVFFIDYFGFSQKDRIAALVASLRARGVSVIQDTVQSWLDNEGTLYGDFCLNSVRKYSPFEASVLLSRSTMSFNYGSVNLRKFLRHKRFAQLLRYYHLKFGVFQSATFLKHIEMSNHLYHNEGIIRMPKLNKWLLNKLDFAALGAERKIVYQELRNKLNPKLVLGESQESSVPLGMAVYLENRDKIKAALHARDIHCPLHWLLSDEIDKKEHAYSWDLQDHELTIPVSVDFKHKQEYTAKLQEVLP